MRKPKYLPGTLLNCDLVGIGQIVILRILEDEGCYLYKRRSEIAWGTSPLKDSFLKIEQYFWKDGFLPSYKLNALWRELCL